LARGVLILIVLQIIIGGLVAGLRAGLGYNTFPLMGNAWFPQGIFSLAHGWMGYFENPAMVQFIHRILSWITLFSVFTLWIKARFQPLSSAQCRSIHALAVMTLVQFALGVATLLLMVPIVIASLHQLCAMLLLLCSLWVVHGMVPHERTYGRMRRIRRLAPCEPAPNNP
jgi:heme a synthase